VKCSDRCRETAKQVLASIGLNEATRETFPEIVRDSSRPGLAELASFFNRHPEAILSQLKYERRQELRLFVKTLTFQRSFLELAEKAATRIPGLNHSKFVRVLKLLYDANARINDFPQIGRIMRAEGGIKTQLEILVGYASVDEGILTTFARRVDAPTRELWTALEEKAKTSRPEFYTRMQQASQQALVMGDISLLYDKSPAAKVAILVTSGAVAGYSYAVSKHTVNVLNDSSIPLDQKVDRIRESPLVPFSTGPDKMSETSLDNDQASGTPEQIQLKQELEEFYTGLEKIHDKIIKDPTEAKRLEEILKSPRH
jgi:hypothetical protein